MKPTSIWYQKNSVNQNTSNDRLKTLERVKLEKSWNYKIVVDCKRDAQTKNDLLNFPTTFLYEKNEIGICNFFSIKCEMRKGNLLLTLNLAA